MPNIILQIIGASCTALVFIESGIPHWVKMRLWGRNAYKHRLKPFDCQLCLAFWLGFISAFLETERHFLIYTCVQAVMIGAASSILAVLLHKIISK